MRLRNDSLRTGYLLSPRPPLADSTSLLLLVAGAADIEPLQHVLKLVETLDFVSGVDIADQRRLDSIHPSINPSRIVRIEARELAGLGSEEIGTILRPALERLASGDLEIFPAAGGAIGGVARGIQFLDREEDLANIETLIRANPTVMVRAPRITGKTSVLRRLQETLPSEYAIQYLDLQRDRDLTTAAARLHSEVARCAFRPAIERVRAAGWERVFIESLTELQSRTRLDALLMLDELVFLIVAGSHNEQEIVNRIGEAMDGLRRVADATGVRLVFADSRDLLEFVDSHAGETPHLLQTAVSYSLHPLAASCLAVQLRRILLGTGLVPDDHDLAWLSRNVDISVPYPGLLFLDEISHQLRRVERLSPDELDRSLSAFLGETDAFRELERHLEDAPLDRRRSVESAIRRLLEFPFEEGAPLSTLRREIPEERDFAWMIEIFPVSSDGERVRCVARLWWRWWRTQTGLDP